MKSAAVLFCVLFAIAMAEDEESAKKLLYKGNNDFTTKFFQDVVKSQADSSVVMSAYSVLTPLAQLSLAAEGESQKELLGSLGLPSTEVVKVAFKAADKELRSVEGVTLKTANRMYIGKESKLNKDFSAVSKEVFDTEVKNVDFSQSTATANEINAWVESQTNNRIKELVSADSITSETRALLVNAIYFKGKWDKPFDAVDTKTRDFFVTKDQKMDVPMMFQNSHYSYAFSTALNAQLLEIPYAKKQASFLVILPKEVDGISDLEKKLKDPTMLTKATEQMYTSEVNVHLPKFKIETTTNLIKVLKNIGVCKIFSRKEANLKKLLDGNEDLYITEAIQKAFIEVNEEGAEAAAANEFVVEVESILIDPRPPIEFNANHPFAFAIKVHDQIIFSGILRK